MRKPTFLLLLLFTLGLTQKLYSQTATVTPDKMNVFYRGVDNPITVVVENCLCKDIVVKTSLGEVYGEGCHYIYRTLDTATSPGVKSTTTSRQVKIYVGVFKDSVLNWIDTIDYRLHLVPDPTPSIGRLEGGSIDKELLCKSAGIIAEGCFDSFTYHVVSYSLEISRKDSVIYKYENIGGIRFDNDLIKFIQESCISNDDLIFYNIIVMGKDGLYRKTNEMNFKIK